MARIGINPARGKQTAYKPPQVTVALLTYIPHLDGYFRHKLDVLKLSLASLAAHTSLPYDLLIFDNGSCPQVVDFLREAQTAGRVDYLLLSRRNIGKIGAFAQIFNAAPGELVAYADDDIFFYPGWLEKHLEIYETYPQVGMVSGSPVRNASERSRRSLDAWMAQSPPGLTITREHRFPDAWDRDWAASTGRDPDAYLEQIRNAQDLILCYQGVEAFGSASHFQFLAPRDVIRQALPQSWSGFLMGKMMELDDAVDAGGYLRLCTVERCTRHLGNTLDAGVLAEARALGVDVDAPLPLRAAQRHWLLKIPGAGRVLRALYDRLFRILNQGT